MDNLHSRILDLLGEVMGLLDLSEFRDGLLIALQDMLPSDYISLNQVASEPGRNWSVVQPPVSAAHFATYYRLAAQNPLADHFLRTRDGRPLRVSDIVTPEQFHATDLYREFYAPLQIEYQIAWALPSDDQHILAIALSRREHDYTDLERQFLTVARPYLIQAYRNALDYTNRSEPTPHGPDETALAALGLTPTQAHILRLLSVGRSITDIAHDLHVAPRTVNKHLQRTYKTLGVTDRFAASAKAWDSARVTSPEAARDYGKET
jgi:DNA-binding CsgD family transcriptional regulator